MRNFYDFTLTELEKAIGALGNEKYRARQLYKWVYHKGVPSFHEMSNISKSLRILFNDMFYTGLPQIKEVLTSRDGSMKFGFQTTDGNTIESVFIPEKERNTLCLSTQIGCKMGCRFCVTGKMGFIRNLSVAEIIGQIMAVKHYLTDKRITNIVFMGMGEPVDNLENLLHSLDIVKNPLGLNFSHRKITVSSVGLIDGLNQIQPKDACIAISLNAAEDKKRTYLMPINRLYPIREVMNFVKTFKGNRRTRITFEYVMLKGINDSLEDAKLLSELLSGVRCKINLIPYNESPYLEYKTPGVDTIERFHTYLLNKHYTTIVRSSRGQDIGGGCGQLGIRYIEERQNGCITGI